MSTPTSIRLSDDGAAILLRLVAELGLSRTGVIELALRVLQERERQAGTLQQHPPKRRTRR